MSDSWQFYLKSLVTLVILAIICLILETMATFMSIKIVATLLSNTLQAIVRTLVRR